MKHTVTIRPAEPADAEALAMLAGELGYPTATDRMAARLKRAAADGGHAVFVAVEGAVAGWIHVTVEHSLESDPHAEIRGLVVAARARRSGIGSLLLRKAEEWAASRGLRRIRVRTNVVRTETRAYYRRRGYTAVKTQEVLDKEPAAADAGRGGS